MPTIFALASGSGRAGVAVVRLSGPQSAAALGALCGRLPAPRRAQVFHVKHPQTQQLIDQALVLWFPGPASFTGEDCAELHVHGGAAVLTSVYEALLTLPGIRLAEPGDFSKRAFLNGKLDLTQAEAIADLVDAETPAQQRLALSQINGDLARGYENWRAQLVALMAQVEAQIDFPDEDIPEDVVIRTRRDLGTLQTELNTQLGMAQAGRAIHGGYRIVILGAPNAGKSSLINALAQRDVAIVSSKPGTTRDVVEIALQLGGYKVILFDTAGLRETDDDIEREGIRRARQQQQQAHLRLWLLDALAPAQHSDIAAGDIVVYNKIDLIDAASIPKCDHAISLATGQGLEALIAALTAHVTSALSDVSGASLTHLRHQQVVSEAVSALQRAAQNYGQVPIELTGEDLRQAAQALARLTGRIGVEDILDQVFAQFCIGK